jgi:hypothetical protein
MKPQMNKCGLWFPQSRSFSFKAVYSVAPALAGSLADFFLSSTLKMEAIRSSQTSVNTSSTRRHIQKDGFLHIHRREKLRSYELNSVRE